MSALLIRAEPDPSVEHAGPDEAAERHARSTTGSAPPALEGLAHDVLATAAGTIRTRRATRPLVGAPGAPLRQTLVGLADSARYGGRSCGSQATVHVLRGRVVLHSAAGHSLHQAGELVSVPDGDHSVEAIGDAAIVVTGMH